MNVPSPGFYLDKKYEKQRDTNCTDKIRSKNTRAEITWAVLRRFYGEVFNEILEKVSRLKTVKIALSLVLIGSNLAAR